MNRTSRRNKSCSFARRWPARVHSSSFAHLKILGRMTAAPSLPVSKVLGFNIEHINECMKAFAPSLLSTLTCRSLTSPTTQAILAPSYRLLVVPLGLWRQRYGLTNRVETCSTYAHISLDVFTQHFRIYSRNPLPTVLPPHDAFHQDAFGFTFPHLAERLLRYSDGMYMGREVRPRLWSYFLSKLLAGRQGHVLDISGGNVSAAAC